MGTKTNSSTRDELDHLQLKKSVRKYPNSLPVKRNGHDRLDVHNLKGVDQSALVVVGKRAELVHLMATRQKKNRLFFPVLRSPLFF